MIYLTELELRLDSLIIYEEQVMARGVVSKLTAPENLIIYFINLNSKYIKYGCR